MQPAFFLFSEKLFKPLSKYVVPIFLGAKEVGTLAPSNSYIDIFNFYSPKHLADYIIHLNKSDAEYIKYFEWKKHYKIKMNSLSYHAAFCELCQYLHGIDKPYKIFNFTKWFSDESGCNNNKIYHYL